MSFKLLFTILFLLSNFIKIKTTKIYKQNILKSLSNQFSLTPLLTLQDLYKSFFQDFWGPEHLISNKTYVEEYLNEELQQIENNKNFLPLFEKTGIEGNFIRVNLKVIKYNLISKELLLKFFIESANENNNTDFNKKFNEWKENWKNIDNIIKKLNLNILNEENDRKKIYNMLYNENKYAISHSNIYKENYDPHYRIIKNNYIKDNFCKDKDNKIKDDNFEFCIKLINCLFENKNIINDDNNNIKFFVNIIKENNINNLVKKIDEFNSKEFYNIKKCIIN